MAPVTEHRDRAQLVLIGALALAVSLVVIALVLNSAIYTHNLASRYQSPADSPSTFARDARLGAGGAMDHANRNRSEYGYSAVVDNYTRGLADLENASGRYAAVNGRTVRIDHVTGSEVEGVRIVDDNESSTFYPASSEPDEWRVAEDVRLRQFDMTVKRSSLVALDTSTVEDALGTGDLTSIVLGDDPFIVNVSDASNEWRVAVYNDTDASDTVSVTVSNVTAGTNRTCSVASAAVTVELSAGRINGRPCKPLSFVDDLSGPHDVTYYYGNSATGTYELTVDGVVDGPGTEAGPFTDPVDTFNYGTHCHGPTYYNATSSDYPRVTPGLYEVVVNTTFDGPDSTHESGRRVAPEEPAGPREAPRVTRFTVTDDSDGTHANFTIDWTVTDPDGNLSDVEITLDGTTTTDSVSGEFASASVDRNVTDGDGSVYDINVTVIDDARNSRTVIQTHEADGDDDTSACPP